MQLLKFSLNDQQKKVIFLIIYLPPEFLTVLGLLTRRYASTLGAALL